MKIYKIWQRDNSGYDTYDSAVVCAVDEDDARSIHPGGGVCIDETVNYDSWVTKSKVVVECIGEAYGDVKRGVIVSSFNAG